MIIFVTSIFIKTGAILSDKTRVNVLIFLIIGYFFIGIHQLFEFLAISFESIYIYKTGLVFSISAMYFNISSSEYLLKRKLGSRLVLIVIFTLSIFIYRTPMYFENMHFYVRGKQNIYWGATWIFLFLYWNFIHLSSFIKSKNKGFKKATILLPTYSLNISFMLAAIYCYSLGLFNKFSIPKDHTQCSPILTNFEIVFDAPSIWCLFASIQGYFIYQYATKVLDEDYNIDFNVKSINLYICGAMAIALALIILFTLPIFSALSVKMILK